MTSHRNASERTGLAAAWALAVAMALAGCWGGDDGPGSAGSPGSFASGQALTAAQISAAQTTLDAQSAPVDVGSSGTTDIAAVQSALDDQSGVMLEGAHQE